ncbi:MAG: TlpA family protein disulfide reductase, partial [Chitinophagaceae bacterium]
MLLPLPYLLAYIYMIWMNEFLALPFGTVVLAGSYFSLISYLYFKKRRVLILASIIYCSLVFIAGNTLFPAWHSYHGNLVNYKHSYLKNSNSTPVFKATYYNLINGNDVALPIGKKKILIDLWATWCAPCVEGIPDFEKLMKNNKDTGLVIYSCLTPSDSDDPAFIQKILKNRQGNFIMCRDSSILDNLQIQGVPTFLLL